MSNLKNISTERNKIVIKPMTSTQLPNKIPIFINKSNKLTLMKGQNSKEVLLKRFKLHETTKNMFKEDIIYESKAGDFLSGNSQCKVTLINRLNLSTNASRTYAKYSFGHVESFQKSSDNLTKLIGQQNYDLVFSALCSVISQELKIRGMLALLTLQTKLKDDLCQTDDVKVEKLNSFEEKGCQTDVVSMNLGFKPKQRRRMRRTQLTPYVVKDSIVSLSAEKKKIIINPDCFIDPPTIGNAQIKHEKTEPNDKYQKESLPDIKQDINHYFNEDSNGSVGNLSTFSASNDNILYNANELLKNIEEHTEETEGQLQISHDTVTTNNYVVTTDNYTVSSYNQMVTVNNPTVTPNNHTVTPVNNTVTPVNNTVTTDTVVSLNSTSTFITMLDGSVIKVCVKPEDNFHIATPEILKSVSDEERRKLLWYQAYIDWKYCLERDEDGNLPIHVAVFNNDWDLLRRQCVVLRNRNSSLDIMACNMTALQMSIFQSNPQCTSMLLQYGADPLCCDDEQRTLLHLAAEATGEHLNVILDFCKNNARVILEDHTDFWHEGLETRSKEELATFLLNHMCIMVDSQGYTPLMVASKAAVSANVKLLAEASPQTINTAMPNSGNTALYLAVGAACLEAENRGNKSKVPQNFSETIKILVRNGASASAINHSGSSVNDLLNELNIADLSMIVCNNTYSMQETKPFDTYMFVKSKDGNVNVENLKKKNKARDFATFSNKTDKLEKTKEKPVILENISLPKSSIIKTTTTPVKDLKIVSPKDRLEKYVAHSSKSVVLKSKDKINKTDVASVGKESYITKSANVVSPKRKMTVKTQTKAKAGKFEIVMLNDDTNVDNDTSNVSHDTSNVSHDTSNVSHDTSNVSHDTSNVSHDTSNVSHDNDWKIGNHSLVTKPEVVPLKRVRKYNKRKLISEEVIVKVKKTKNLT